MESNLFRLVCEACGDELIHKGRELDDDCEGHYERFECKGCNSVWRLYLRLEKAGKITRECKECGETFETDAVQNEVFCSHQCWDDYTGNVVIR